MNENFTSDMHLLDAMRVNDTSAFEEVFNRHWFHIYQYAFRKLNSEEKAKEITRGIFIYLWENRMTIPADFSLLSFLYSRLRKDVTAHLYKQICEENSSAFADHLSAEFSFQHLQTAYLPVMPQAIHETITEAPVYKQTPAYYPFKKRMQDAWHTGTRILMHDIPLTMRRTFL